MIWQEKPFLTFVTYSVFIPCLMCIAPIAVLSGCNSFESRSQFAEQVFWLTSSGCSDDTEARRNGTGLASRECPMQGGM